MTRSRLFIWVIVAACLLIGVFWAFWPRRVAIDIDYVTRAPLSVQITDEGEARARDTYAVSAPISGIMDRIVFEPGDCVEADLTHLAMITPREPAPLDRRTRREREALLAASESAVQAAEADLAALQSRLERAATHQARMERLFARGTIAPAQLDDADTALTSLRAEVRAADARRTSARQSAEVARAGLIVPGGSAASGGYVVTAPVSGTVLEVYRESGGPVSEGEQLLTIGRRTDLKFMIELLSEEAVRVRPGDRATIRNWGGPALAGKVARVEPYAFSEISALGIEEQRVRVWIETAIVPPPIGQGYRIDADIEIWREENVLQAPLTALFRQDGTWWTFRVESGRVHKQPVSLGHMNASHAEIRAGLSEADQLVRHPSKKISQGVRVKARDQAARLEPGRMSEGPDVPDLRPQPDDCAPLSDFGERTEHQIAARRTKE